MSRLIAALEVLALLAGFFALAVPASLACCAGVVEAHGMACCESASFDALAQSCCQGGGEEITLSPERPLAPPVVAATAPPMGPVLSPARLPRLPRTTADLAPRGGLFTLHSALLI